MSIRRVLSTIVLIFAFGVSLSGATASTAYACDNHGTGLC